MSRPTAPNLARLGYALYIAVDLADILTRPVNQSWIEVLIIFLAPVFVGVASLLLASVFLVRYAWYGVFFDRPRSRR